MRFLVLLFITGFSAALFAQAPGSTELYAYWIAFKHKDSSLHMLHEPHLFLGDRAISRRKRFGIPVDMLDLPVDRQHKKYFLERGYAIYSSSKWLNSITILSKGKTLPDNITKLSFIKEVTYLGKINEASIYRNEQDIKDLLSNLEMRTENLRKKSIDTSYYGKAFLQNEMINASPLHQLGFKGNGVHIAIIDAGFKNIPAVPFFRHILDSGLLLGSYDFVDRQYNVFDDDDHGGAVLSCMAAYKPFEYVGISPHASYWLLRSENAATEQLLEEALWAEAAEFADSAGVDVINSSLGYYAFDDKKMNHKSRQLDGKTTIISRAASIAATKGILMINSAGNEGDTKWKQIAFPADVSGVLTVGSVDRNKIHSVFSSIGPSADNRIKPDVVAMGQEAYLISSSGYIYQGNGTSYASPMIAAGAACLLQASKESSPATIISAIRLSAHQYYRPDKLVGYGIPDFFLAYRILLAQQSKVDDCVDMRWLDDKQLHLTVYATQPQKITIVFYDEVGNQIMTLTEKIKQSGISRLYVKKAQQLSKGVYEVRVNLMNGSQRMMMSKTF